MIGIAAFSAGVLAGWAVGMWAAARSRPRVMFLRCRRDECRGRLMYALVHFADDAAVRPDVIVFCCAHQARALWEVDSREVARGRWAWAEANGYGDQSEGGR